MYNRVGINSSPFFTVRIQEEVMEEDARQKKAATGTCILQQNTEQALKQNDHLVLEEEKLVC